MIELLPAAAALTLEDDDPATGVMIGCEALFNADEGNDDDGNDDDDNDDDSLLVDLAADDGRSSFSIISPSRAAASP
jgi:hypothetical protein